MSFLTPLFFFGALAIAGPVIFHLIRRTTRERTVFSSLQFLEPSPPRLTRRSRIEHWLLLALRCLALGLLAFGFARPFLPKAAIIDPSDRQAKRVILLVDTSASLQRPGAWNATRERVQARARELANISELGLITFDRTTRSLLSFADWKGTPEGDRASVVRDRLNTTKPSWAGTQLAAALVTAAEALNEPTTGPEPQSRQIILISDLQEGSHLESLQAYEWPKGVEVVVEPIPVRPAGNAGLQLVTEEASATPSSNLVVRVRVSNTADASRDQFEVGWRRPDGNGFLGAPAKTYVPAGQSRTVALPLLEGVTMDRIGLTGDEAEFDNTVFVAPPEVTQARVLYIGADADGEARQPFFFLHHAFPEGGRPSVHWTARTPGTLTTEDVTGGLMIVTEAVPSPSATAIRDAVNAGGTLLLVLRSPAAATTLGEILGVPGLAVQEAATNGSYALLGEIDFRHPLFAPFLDSRFSDFTKVRFWKHRKFEANAIPGARVLARLDSGDPGLVEVALGRGRVLVLSAGWHPDDSQFALSTKFVPFLHALLEYSGAIPPVAVAQQFVGDVLALPTVGSDQERKLRLPDGTERTLSPRTTNFADANMPGLYRLLTASATFALAVNLDPTESRTRPSAGDELERLGVPLRATERPAAESKARREHVQAEEAESQQKLWRWFLGATMIILLLETAAAGWSARRNLQPTEATT
ncbi:MAG TPA: hypothetical protein DCE44_19905 [Verrucomicrobiales bacterium]|nr:hypothetical protein [Verrucomicrobiales bacterium]